MQDELILKYNIGASEEPFICLRDVTRLQGSYIKEFINNAHNKFHSVNPDIKKEKYEDITAFKPPQETPSTLGEKLSDKLAEFGGSWTFIGCFAFVMVTWISFNSIALLKGTFDPYPFILLNLVLSCLAAIQAPIIMMSQNRQEKKDRVRAESDYLVNVKAELEIRQLHSKLDMLLSQGS
jgi:uncharacterized membrane protein